MWWKLLFASSDGRVGITDSGTLRFLIGVICALSFSNGCGKSDLTNIIRPRRSPQTYTG